VNDVAVQKKDGSFLSVALTRSPVHDDAGKVIAMVRVMRDMTERYRIERELREANVALERSRAAMQELAMRDELTGLYNRRELVHRLTGEIDRAARTGRPLSFVLLDVDHFKSINDQFGHQTGDVVLRVIATRLSGTLRGGDLLFRYGGEEFFLLLEGTDATGAIAVATRSINAIQSEPIMNIEVTASAGTAHWHPQVMEPSDLLSAADSALYEAKRSGRAQVKSWASMEQHALEPNESAVAPEPSV
jgi:diguanylate cyclase (GGDEF)-like protein